MPPLVIATRASPLALYQARWVQQKLASLLQRRGIKREIMLLQVKAIDYRHKDAFVRGCQEKVLTKEADIAVHSAKDMPIRSQPDLCIAAFCERGHVSDALVGNYGWSDLPVGARLGTTSLRRKTHLLALRPDLRIVELRGNVETRIAATHRSAAKEGLDAVVLATAGLVRLGQDHLIRHRFRRQEILPAPGQGAYGIECRAEDAETRELVAELNHARSAHCIKVERLFCHYIGGDCYAPLAAHAYVQENTMRLEAMVGRSHSGEMIKVTRSCALTAGDMRILNAVTALDEGAIARLMARGSRLAAAAAQHLLRRGAKAMLAG